MRVPHPQTTLSFLPLNLRAAARQSIADSVERVPPEFNINSGGPATGRFVAENYQWIKGDTSSFAKSDAVIGGAEEKNIPIYKSHRYGRGATTWGYDIPVMEPGTYACTVHFAETYSAAFFIGKRVFDLVLATAHGEPVRFFAIDVFEELNKAKFTALTKTPDKPLVITGVLAIRVVPIEGDAFISGVTCERLGDLPEGVMADFETDPDLPTVAVGDTDDSAGSSPGVVVSGTEININCGGPSIGRFLAEDYNWITGNTSQWAGPKGVIVGGAEAKNRPAGLSHRYGRFQKPWSYNIPVQRSGYFECSLHFSETDSNSFFQNARVFDVMIQDQVLKSIDVYRDAGSSEFVSVVKTFVRLRIVDRLVISFRPIIGNAFISAITCEMTKDLEEFQPEASPGSVLEDELSSNADIALVSPSPEESFELLKPFPTASSVASLVETAPPDVSPSETSSETSPDVSPSETPSKSPSPMPTPSAEPSPPPIDSELVPKENQMVWDYDLAAKVKDGGPFTQTMKDALIDVSKNSSVENIDFAMITLTEEVVRGFVRSLFLSMRQLEDEREYNVKMQGLHRKTPGKIGVTEYMKFIKNGDINKKLRQKDVTALEVRLSPTTGVFIPDEKGSNASTSESSRTVGIAIGSVLGGLVIITIVAFVVVKRKRNNEPGAAGFDAPPPAMSESETSSVMDRSENGASVEYLDDDSTFTAATSRAGDHIDQVAFEKDVFGRGTADARHKVS